MILTIQNFECELSIYLEVQNGILNVKCYQNAYISSAGVNQFL